MPAVHLTDRQQNDLDKAILNYMQSRNFKQSLATFSAEVGIDSPESAIDPKLDGVLEKKWIAVIRLQKKVIDLENQLSQMKEELNSSLANGGKAASNVDWTPKGSARYELAGHRDDVRRVAFHPVFSILASASSDKMIKIWDWETGELERTLKGHTRDVRDVDFDPRGNWLVSASSDLTIKLWAVDSWDRPGYAAQTMHGHDHTVSSARFMSTGDFIVSSSRDKTIRIWEVATKFCIKTIAAHENWVRSVMPSTDDRWLVSCSSDHTARIWDYKTGQMKAECRQHDNLVETAVFAPVNTYQFIRTLTGSPETSEDPGAYVFTAARDTLIMLWEAQTGRHLRTFAGHENWVQSLAFHPTGKFLLSAGDDKTIRSWDLASGRCVRVVEAHHPFVTSIAWAPPSKADASGKTPARQRNVLASAGTDFLVKIWAP